MKPLRRLRRLVRRKPVLPAPPDAAGQPIGPPDFVGIGAMKCGTSWWYRMIAAHPGVASLRKELHYLDQFTEVTDADPAAYHRYFPRPEGVLAGEWTPRYMHDVVAPAMLARLAPTAKVLVLLRDPVERYISGLAHEHRVGRGVAPLLQRDQFARSLYHLQLERVLRHFPREQLLVLQLERCAADPAGEAARTLAFLGLSPTTETAEALARSVNRKEGWRPDLSAATRRELVESMRGDVDRLVAAFDEVDRDLWPNFA